MNGPRIGLRWVTPKSAATEMRNSPEGSDCIDLTSAAASPASLTTRRARS